MKRFGLLALLVGSACTGPSTGTYVLARDFAIRRAQHECELPIEDVYHVPIPYHADISDGEWHVWGGTQECHFFNATVNASDGRVSECLIVVCSG